MEKSEEKRKNSLGRLDREKRILEERKLESWGKGNRERAKIGGGGEQKQTVGKGRKM